MGGCLNIHCRWKSKVWRGQGLCPRSFRESHREQAQEFDLLAPGWPSLFKIPRKQHRIIYAGRELQDHHAQHLKAISSTTALLSWRDLLGILGKNTKLYSKCCLWARRVKCHWKCNHHCIQVGYYTLLKEQKATSFSLRALSNEFLGINTSKYNFKTIWHWLSVEHWASFRRKAFFRHMLKQKKP